MLTTKIYHSDLKVGILFENGIGKTTPVLQYKCLPNLSYYPFHRSRYLKQSIHKYSHQRNVFTRLKDPGTPASPLLEISTWYLDRISEVTSILFCFGGLKVPIFRMRFSILVHRAYDVGNYFLEASFPN